MKARFIGNKVSIKTLPWGNHDIVWSGDVEFSDGYKCGFEWNRTLNTLKLVTEVEDHPRWTSKNLGVAAHSRRVTAKGNRRKALLELLYEYDIYWAD